MIIGISGKIGSGKDTVGKMIQYLTEFQSEDCSFEEYLNMKIIGHNWQIEKFGGAVKDIVCILIGCTREQLEDEEFKNTPLGEEWRVWRYKLDYEANLFDGMVQFEKGAFFSRREAEEFRDTHFIINVLDIYSEVLTPRKLMQLLGTDAGRNIIHPNIWINTLFSKYKPQNPYQYIRVIKSRKTSVGGSYEIELDYPWITEGELLFNGDYIVNNFDEKKGIYFVTPQVENPIKILPGLEAHAYESPLEMLDYPKWLITDVRFPNEVKAIKQRGGKIIRINRLQSDKYYWTDPDEGKCSGEYYLTGKTEFTAHLINESGSVLNAPFEELTKIKPHFSETALDNYTDWDYSINNVGSLESLLHQIKIIVKNENLI